MSNISVKNYYLSFIDKEIQAHDDITRHHVHDFAESIIDFVINYEDAEFLKELDYSMIKKIVESDDVTNIQYALHLLALEPHDVLNWVFYVEDSSNHYEPTRIYLKPKDLAKILREEDFHDPITGNKVTKEYFSELVNTVFKVSDNFIKKVSQDDIRGYS